MSYEGNHQGRMDTLHEGFVDFWIPAAAMRPRVSNGCSAFAKATTTVGNPDLQYLECTVGTDEWFQFSFIIPESWYYDGENDFRVKIYYTLIDGSSGSVFMNNAHFFISNDDSMDKVADDSGVVGGTISSYTPEDLHIAVEDGPFAESVATDDLVICQWGWDAATSFNGSVVRILGAKVYYSTNAMNDDAP